MLYLKKLLNIYDLLQVLVLGQPGEEVSLELILRVVADVGLVVSVAYFLSLYMSCLYAYILVFYNNISTWIIRIFI